MPGERRSPPWAPLWCAGRSRVPYNRSYDELPGNRALRRFTMAPFRVFALLLTLVASLVMPPSSLSAAAPPFHELWRAGQADAFGGWTLAGVRASDGRLVLDPAATRGLDGVPSERPGDIATVPSGGAGAVGLALGPVREPAEAFTELIPSWNVATPPGTWVEVRTRARIGDRWTGWYAFGSWSTDDVRGRRESVANQRDDDGRVLTDTLRLRTPATAFQLALALYADDVAQTPAIDMAAALASRPSEAARDLAADRSTWGTVLDVPERSQMVYPNGGPVWCSPTSTSMVMAYWSDRLGVPSLSRPVPEVAAAVYDPVYRGNGNWSFNVAYAARDGLTAYVSRMSSVAQLERWIGAGVPIVASLAWDPGDLPNASVPSTNGHLLVVVGLTASGQVVVNDPAADPRLGQSVRRVYDRARFEALWLKHSGGTVYLIHPSSQVPPADGAFGAW